MLRVKVLIASDEAYRLDESQTYEVQIVNLIESFCKGKKVVNIQIPSISLAYVIYEGE